MYRGGAIWLDEEKGNEAEKLKVVTKESAYQITAMMRQVLRRGGTGWHLRSGGRLDFDVVGKTGTSQKSRDLWFAG